MYITRQGQAWDEIANAFGNGGVQISSQKRILETYARENGFMNLSKPVYGYLIENREYTAARHLLSGCVRIWFRRCFLLREANLDAVTNLSSPIPCTENG